jgi:DNA recombination protein RmuC
VGQRLSKAVEAYNSAVGSLERQVMPQARRFPELGVTADAALAPVEPIAQLARKPGGGPEKTPASAEPPANEAPVTAGADTEPESKRH